MSPILIRDEVLRILDYKEFIVALNLKSRSKTLDEVIFHFNDEENFKQWRVLVERIYADANTFKRIDVLYDERPIESSSFGQRCTAALVVLLLLGNHPIIIDEPEAHLDSLLIANQLVDIIKLKKKERQIIFATHNANFVINGDAELIQILSTIDGRTAIQPATIEDLKFRNNLLALEGGHDAFQNRERRYGVHDKVLDTLKDASPKQKRPDKPPRA